MVKTLYIYGGTDREKLEKELESGAAPDTSFFGLFGVRKDPRIQADYLQIRKDTFKFAGGLVRGSELLRNLYLAFVFYKKLNSYDAIVLTSSAHFGVLLFRKLGFFRRQRWLLLNIDLSNLLKKRRGFSRRLLLSSIKEADKVICLSRAQQKHLESVGVTPSRLIFVPLGVDMRFYRALPPSDEFVFTVGRDIGRDLKTLFGTLRQLGKEAVVVCTIENLAGLEREVPPNVTVLHEQSYLDVRSLYEQSSCFVIATKPESHLVGSDCPGQTAVLDSMAYGRPVVATRNVWFDGYFEEGKHIVTAPPEDPAALAETVRRVLSNGSLRERMAREGRKLIEERCNSDEMGRRIAETILAVA